jgi:hypothetical protein
MIMIINLNSNKALIVIIIHKVFKRNNNNNKIHICKLINHNKIILV